MELVEDEEVDWSSEEELSSPPGPGQPPSAAHASMASEHTSRYWYSQCLSEWPLSWDRSNVMVRLVGPSCVPLSVGMTSRPPLHGT